MSISGGIKVQSREEEKETRRLAGYELKKTKENGRKIGNSAVRLNEIAADGKGQENRTGRE